MKLKHAFNESSATEYRLTLTPEEMITLYKIADSHIQSKEAGMEFDSSPAARNVFGSICQTWYRLHRAKADPDYRIEPWLSPLDEFVREAQALFAKYKFLQFVQRDKQGKVHAVISEV